MEMLKKLDKVLTSDNVVGDFYNLYDNDLEFKNWLDTNIPEVKQCDEQKQDNPWHVYNVLGHILYSVEAMNSLSKKYSKSERRMLSYVMFFHDIGKPACHITRTKNGKLIDSFFNHNKASAKIASKYLDKLGFTDKEVKAMLELIVKHDIFMFITIDPDNNRFHRPLTNELIQDEIKELNNYGDGVKLMEMLLKVGRSDSMAQNKKMTKSSFDLLDKFEQMFNNLNKTR